MGCGGQSFGDPFRRSKNGDPFGHKEMPVSADALCPGLSKWVFPHHPPLDAWGKGGRVFPWSGCRVATISSQPRLAFLQANPLESFNEHISAYRSHFIYWESEDVASFVVDQYMEEIEASRRRARDRVVPGMNRVAINTHEFV